MATPPVRALEEADVAHSLHTYEVDEGVGEGYGEEAA
jgi:hypothetical protein